MTCFDPRWLRREDGTCSECGEAWQVELFEVYRDHTFTLDACCEAVCRAANELVIASDVWPEDAVQLLSDLGADEIFGKNSLRRVADDHEAMGIFLDYDPTIGPIERSVAMDFIREHHEHCGGLPGWRFGAGIWNGPTLLRVVVVGNVSGRGFNGRGWLEVRRVCLNRGIPQSLRWKACSMLYRWAAAEAERRGWLKIITYTLSEESGMTLRYARWKHVAVRRARTGWNCAARPRTNPTPLSAKVLWEKQLNPRPDAVAAREASEAEKGRRRAKATIRENAQLRLAA
jgi:hypothetical protein